MRKAIVVFSSLFLCLSLFKVGAVVAEEGAVGQAEVGADVEGQQGSSDFGWKQQFSDERQQLQEQGKEIKDNMEAAREEEKQLRQRIADALEAGDPQTAAQLKEELKVMHQENVQGMQQDREAMQAAKQELKSNIQEARQAGSLPIEQQGESGTNVVNPPGPMGGPGAGPEGMPRFDRDNNPPGPKGGPGTNWENKPGPQGGPGAGPDRKPGMGNPPGPKGGPGAGPRKSQGAPQGGGPRGGGNRK